MKILIADDERMVRLGLINMIEELFPGKYIYLEAANGEDAIQITNAEKPEYAFLDIRMPNKDGITVLKELRENYPLLQIAILTGFAEFDYAQKAIQYGVQEYLLKPCSLDDIQKVLNKMEECFHSDFKRMDSTIPFQIPNLMDLYFNVGITPGGEFDTIGPYSFCIFYIDTPSKDMVGNQIHNIVKVIKQYSFPVDINWCIYFLQTGEVCLLTIGKASERVLLNFINSIQKNNLLYTTVTYLTEITIKDLLEKITVCQEHNYLRCYHYLKIVSIDELLDYIDSSLLLNLSYYVELAALSYNLCDEATYKTAIMRLENIKNSNNIVNPEILINILSFFQGTTNYPINANTLSEFIKNMPFSVSEHVNLGKMDGDMINKVKVFIDKNFDQDISIKKLGELFDISPNYLSKLFHDKTGMCYIDYLTEIRVNAAKELLCRHPSLKIQDISTKIGYYSPRHFTKTFQKCTGLLPAEYRKSIIG